MKKVLYFVLCVFLFILCVGCNTDKTPEDPTLWQLTKQTTIQANGNTSVTAFSYNEQGKLISYEVSANGTVNSKNEIGYDKDGYKNHEKSTSASGLVTEVFFTNDTDGNILKQRTVITIQGSTMESVSEFEYTDEYGSFVQKFVSGTAKGNTVTVTKDKHGNEIAHITSNGSSIQYENKYAGDVLIEKISKQSTPSGLVVTKILYEYDENGNNIKTTSYDEFDAVILTQIYEYSASTT